MTSAILLASLLLTAAPETIDVWPGTAPGETGNIGPERTEPQRANEQPPTTRITDVSHPTLTVFTPPADNNRGVGVVICPGGGYRILAWDKEGTEVAEWLNTLGVTAFVLKYRVPARDPERRWLAAVQDAQRAVRLVRHRASEWGVNPEKIGILGFSAGGDTAARTALMEKSQYEPIDAVDETSSRPNFAVLIYPAYLVDEKTSKLREELRVDSNSPPMFFAHATNDRVTPMSSVLLYSALKQANVPAELHIYSTGGHGFGMRESANPCSRWPQLCGDWLYAQEILPRDLPKADR